MADGAGRRHREQAGGDGMGAVVNRRRWTKAQAAMGWRRRSSLFDGLPNGAYTVTLHTNTLPPNMALTTPNDLAITLTSGSPDDLDADFGADDTGSIGNFVWADDNGDGTQDEGAGAGIADITVSLYDITGTLVATTTTDASGIYTFAGLAPDQYSVYADESDPDMPAGYEPTTTNPLPVTLTAGQQYEDADFGFTDYGAIGDRIWEDENGDGVQDAGELGLADVQMILTDDFGNTQYATTDATGIYTFTDLPSGAYTVTVNAATLPAGYAQTGDPDATLDGQHVVNLGIGENYDDADFGYDGTGVIGDFVWRDLDGDGMQDGGSETGIPNITVWLYEDQDGDGTIDPGEPLLMTDTTDANGLYSFAGLPPGDYVVDVDENDPQMPDYTNSTLDPLAVDLGPGQIYNDADFGFGPYAQIGDYVWNDINGDTNQDAGEPPLAGVVITLTPPSDVDAGNGPGVPVTTTTDPNGYYLFDVQDTTPVVGTVYTLTVQTPAGYQLTTSNDPYVETLTVGEYHTDADFGFRGSGSIGDYVWDDADGQGDQDAGESGLPGITVYLFEDSNGNGRNDDGEPFVGTTPTDANGIYTFTNLPAGDYVVLVQEDDPNLPANYGPTTFQPIPVSLAEDEIYQDADFGFGPSGSIGDTVYYDANGNGEYDTGTTEEYGIPGITVWLYSDPNGDGDPSDGSIISTTGTITDGFYFFGGLPANGSIDYVVVMHTSDPQIPAGLQLTTLNPYPVQNLLAGQFYDEADFGLRGTSAIGDFVWHDTDGEGDQDEGAGSGIGDITVELWEESNGISGLQTGPGGDDRVAVTSTLASGIYTFTNLVDGTYYVDVDERDPDLPAGYSLTTGNDPYQTTIYTHHTYVDSADFGFGAFVNIGDFVWDDLNRNGRQDDGEPGLDVVTVLLYDAGPDGDCSVPGDWVITSTNTTTAGGGLYSFSGLPGNTTYCIDVVEATLPVGYLPTLDNRPPDDDGDSDSIGGAPAKLITISGIYDNVDFGFYQLQPAFTLVKTLIDPPSGVAVVSDTITFTVRITNTGETVINSLAITDTWDACMDLTSADPVTDTQTASQATWNLTGLSLAIGAGTVISVDFHALSADPDCFNYATATALDENGQQAGPVSDSEPVQIERPELTVVKTLVDPATGVAVVSDTITYTLRITNSGSSPIASLTITDTYDPNFLTLTSFDPPFDGHDPVAGVITWTASLAGFLPLDPTQSFTITVDFHADAPTVSEPGGVTTNTATAQGEDVYGFPVGPEQGSDDVEIPSSVVGIEVSKRLTDPAEGIAVVSDTITYTLRFTNSGDTPIGSLTITDTYDPNYLTLTSFDPPFDGHDPVAGVITWTASLAGFLPLDPTQSFTITVDFHAKAPTVELPGGVTTNTVTVEGEDAYGQKVDPKSDQDDVQINAEYGDAPEGGVAYPSTGTLGQFPTCQTVGPAAWVQHGLGWAYFTMPGAPQAAWDAEPDGNAGLCPTCFPTYDGDECFLDGDAGLMFPEPYTIIGPTGSETVVKCPNAATGTALGAVNQTAVWGVDVDIWVVNNMPVVGYVNVLMDWNQNGVWTDPGEHVLVDFPVPVGYSGPLSAAPGGPPPSFVIGPNGGYVWSRFSVTEKSVGGAGWDGSGVFEDGESEDYLLFVENPVIGLAKDATTVLNNGDGTYTITFTLTISNYGDVVLNNLVITDDIATQFAGLSPTGYSASNGTLTASGTWDGTAGSNILAGGQSLGVGASGTVLISFTVTPGSTTSVNNTAYAAGASPGGTAVTDQSQDGLDPDPDGNDDPTDNSDPTPVNFAENPVIGLAKEATTVLNNGDGTYTITFTLTISNYGDVVLDNLVITDDIATQFAAPVDMSPTGYSATSGTLTASGSWNGTSGSNILVAGQSLAVGASKTVYISFTVTPGSATAEENTAYASGESPAGATVTDQSQDGLDPDPDGNNDPADDPTGPFYDNDEPTPVSFAENPVIGAAKDVASVTGNGDGTYTVVYTITLENLGDVILHSVQVTDDLDITFAGAVSYTVDSVSSTYFTVNWPPDPAPNYDGSTDINLLTGGDSLAVGDVRTVMLTVILNPGSNTGPYNNSAYVYGTSPAGTTVSDWSDPGINPDPSGNGDPSDGGYEDNPTPLELAQVWGHIFEDTNGDGDQDPGEPNLINVSVVVTDSGGVAQTFTTDASGNYTATVTAGSTTADVDETTLPPNYVQTAGTDPTTVNAPAGSLTHIGDDGYQPPLATVGDLVWWDINGDGVQDGGEPGIEGVDVVLSDGGSWTTTTDANGLYTFTNVLSDTYNITIPAYEFAPGGTMHTWFGSPRDVVTTTDALDSDADPVSHQITTTLDWAEVDPTQDFGFDITSSYTITKQLNTVEPVRVDRPLTFSIRITNTGWTMITVLPLQDVYSTTYMTYGYTDTFGVGTFASPDSDDHHNDGVIDWSDLTVSLGDLAPNGSVTVIVTFTAKADTHHVGLPNDETEDTATAHDVRADPDGPGGPLPEETLPADLATESVGIVLPTGVVLGSLNAMARPDGVLVNWQTASELEVLGFNLLRAEAGREWELLNEQFIFAEWAGAEWGADYGYRDEAVLPGITYAYVLEIVKLDGSVERYDVPAVTARWWGNLPLMAR